MATVTPIGTAPLGSTSSLYAFISEQLAITNENGEIVEALEAYCLSLPDQQAVFDFLRPALGSRIAAGRSDHDRYYLGESARDANGAGSPADYRGVDGDPLPIPEPGILDMRWLERPIQEHGIDAVMGVKVHVTWGSASVEVHQDCARHYRGISATYESKATKHDRAIAMIRDAGKTCLAEVDGVTHFDLEDPLEGATELE